MTIHEKMVAVMRDIGAIGKDQNNAQQGFKFRGIDQVYNQLHNVMSKHGVFSVPEVLEKERTERTTSRGGVLAFTCLRMKYTFYAEDGTSVECVVEGEGMDSGDKSSNKAMAVAHKYALLQAFCIPTEEVKDPDAESHEIADNPKMDKAVADLELAASFGTKTFREEWKNVPKSIKDKIDEKKIEEWKKTATAYDKQDVA